MMRPFIKTIDCGCVVKALTVGIKTISGNKMYLLGGHDHLIICDICKKLEEEDDTLHDMWSNDNMTDDNGYADWVQYNHK